MIPVSHKAGTIGCSSEVEVITCAYKREGQVK